MHTKTLSADLIIDNAKCPLLFTLSTSINRATDCHGLLIKEV